MENDRWFKIFKEHSENDFILFCFHYAGGSASHYKEWANDLIKGIDLVAVQMPGRENRFAEKIIDNMEKLINVLSENFSTFKNKKIIFFGHSLGALVAFELLKKLESEAFLDFRHLIVSASRAPHLEIHRKPIYNLPDEEIIQEIQKFKGIPEELLEEKELLRKIMVPIIRADFCISDLYKCSANDKISSPITAFGGSEDHTFPLEHLLMWRIHSENFSYELFKGGHFFTKTSYKDVISSINKILAKEINCEC